MDIFFTLLVTLKIGCKWFALSKIFQKSTDTFKKKINSFAHYIPEHISEVFINKLEDHLSERMKSLKLQTLNVQNTPSVLCSKTEIALWEHLNESDIVIQKQHANYGFKSEFSVRPNGVSFIVPHHRRGQHA